MALQSASYRDERTGDHLVMKTAISAAARELAEQTENLVSRVCVPVRIVPGDDSQFLESRVCCATAGQVVVSQVTGTFRALRSRALISSTDQELVEVALNLVDAGQGVASRPDSMRRDTYLRLLLSRLSCPVSI